MDYYKIKYPMRLDQVAYAVYKDVAFTKDLLEANPNLVQYTILKKETFVILPKIINTDYTNKGNLWS